MRTPLFWFRVWEFPKIRGNVFWGPYYKDPIFRVLNQGPLGRLWATCSRDYNKTTERQCNLSIAAEHGLES